MSKGRAGRLHIVYLRRVLPFRATECVLGPLGLLLVGAREPGTRIVRRTATGFFEIPIPFQPTRHRPAAWGEGGAFRVVGRDGELVTVLADGTTTRETVEYAGVLAGIEGDIVVGVGPKFFELEGGSFVDVTPPPVSTGDTDFTNLADNTKLVTAIAGGPRPAVFVKGGVYSRTAKGWIERAVPDARIVAAAATAKGTVYGASERDLFRVDGKGVTVRAHGLEGARIRSLAVGIEALLIGTDRGLFGFRDRVGTPIRLPRAGAVPDVACYGDVEVGIQEGLPFARRYDDGEFSEWEMINIPVPK